MSDHISIIQGDITRAQVDAIVNAANPKMLGGGGVDGAIHLAAGPKLLQACRQVPAVNGVRCPTGEARITSAGDLQAKFVIHTVGPVYTREDSPAVLLASAYRSSFQLALDNACRSVAVPAISCGVYGYPVKEAAEIAMAEAMSFAKLKIYFYLFGQATMAAWQKTHSQLK